MLIRFGTANHYSINEYTQLSFIASNSLKDQQAELIPFGDRLNILPAVIVYGANASGKTTMLTALRNIRKHVIDSASSLKPGQRIPRSPFRLSSDGNNKPTRYDCDFIIDDTRHHYGFEFLGDIYIQEWLYAYPEGQPRLMFSRGEDGFSFGRHLKGQNRVIESLTRSNALFVSTAAQNAHPYLTKVYNYFKDKIKFLGCSSDHDDVERTLPESGELDSRIIHFLQIADTGIHAATIKKRRVSEESKSITKQIFDALSTVLPPDVPAQALEKANNRRELRFGHVGKDIDNLVYLPLQQESRGTIRLVQLLIMALEVLDDGGLLIVDELDSSLHTVLAREFIRMFNHQSSTSRGQLLASTHDTNLLADNTVRRDQVWLAQKTPWGETELSPLTDIRTRKDDNLERLYLQGRLGALPSAPLDAMTLERGNHG